MAKKDDLSPEFEDLNTPVEELEGAPVDGMPDPTAESDEPLPNEKPAKKKKGRKPKGPSSEKQSIVAAITQADPYTVLLAISLATIFIAIVYMAMGLISYGGDYKAKAAKQAAAPTFIRFIEPIQTRVA